MKLVILDRDGVLNPDCEEFIASPDEWHALPGALEAVARLNHAGFHVVLATDQSGLGRGLFDVASLNAIHGKLHKQLATFGGRVDAVFYCPHSPEESCDCRMPHPGLFLQIGDRLGMELTGVAACGNRPAFLQAAAAAGCDPHLVLTGHIAELDLADLREIFPAGTRIHPDLAAFAESLLSHQVLSPAPSPSPTAAPAA